MLEKIDARALFRHVAEALSGKFMTNPNGGVVIRNGVRHTD